MYGSIVCRYKSRLSLITPIRCFCLRYACGTEPWIVLFSQLCLIVYTNTFKMMPVVAIVTLDSRSSIILFVTTASTGQPTLTESPQ